MGTATFPTNKPPENGDEAGGRARASQSAQTRLAGHKAAKKREKARAQPAVGC
jgi:hypothetical protein